MPLSPRPTAAQAIEVLKVYQLRRENTVILNEINALRDEIISLRTALPECQTRISSLESRWNATDETVKKQNLELIKAAATGQTCVDSIAGVRREFDIHSASTKDEFDAINASNLDLIKRVDLIREQLAESACKNFERIQGIETAIETIRADAATKGDLKPLENLENKVDPLMRRVSGHGRQEFGSASVVAETASNEVRSNTQTGHPAHQTSHDASLWKFIGSDISSELGLDQTADEDATMSTEEQARHDSALRQDSTKPQDEALTSPGPPSQSVLSASIMDRRLLPTDLYAILNLRQFEGEHISEYFNRNLAIVERYKDHEEALRICLRRFVQGIPQPELVDFVFKWLDTSDWTLRDMRDCVVLLGLGASTKTTFASLEVANEAAIRHASRDNSDQSRENGVPSRERDLSDRIADSRPEDCRVPQQLTDRGAESSLRSQEAQKKPAARKRRYRGKIRKCSCRGAKHDPKNHRARCSGLHRPVTRSQTKDDNTYPETPEGQPCVPERSDRPANPPVAKSQTRRASKLSRVSVPCVQSRPIKLGWNFDRTPTLVSAKRTAELLVPQSSDEISLPCLDS